jgi:hypothetical protein
MGKPIARAMGVVARARAMSQLAQDTGLERANRFGLSNVEWRQARAKNQAIRLRSRVVYDGAVETEARNRLRPLVFSPVISRA